jgi:hypothetical protein
MLKYVALFTALAACGPALAQESPTSARVEGRFVGGSAGYAQELVIERTGNDRYSVRASVSTQGCSGRFAGTGSVEGKTMVITDAAGACTLNLMRAGPNVQIDEEGCEGAHGPSCDFSGTYRRR